MIAVFLSKVSVVLDLHNTTKLIFLWFHLILACLGSHAAYMTIEREAMAVDHSINVDKKNILP